ncbi:hypothetical protein R2325_16330 [Mycobacteroides chelonae]|jgi:hypothetical protein|uniref:hypothetical protein n=1 Tax=Mycobacteroides TaxID=670516 RepID=UPI0009265146|nr:MULTISPECIES: hypothetical protein [Mycobacteroides]MBV6360421.1 hypothetical protein [Mycobacteroides chelonae]MEC4857142.1 hypothetical protein [Mycobacteroides chelonae]MEC4873552.1 hypothetical protein [Mycobacteroides chelonae]SHW93417.1 Uncharacterised protein [Mycobacteroides abscessus subsp. abscessus]SKL81328.1 Uncharacterised protein [Mycobacteroides abscessus subsp. abscessus]
MSAGTDPLFTAAKLLESNGYAVVKLPEPTPSNDPAILGEWLGGEVMVYRDGRMELDWHSIDAKVAHKVGLCLIAAHSLAAAADGSTGGVVKL